MFKELLELKWYQIQQNDFLFKKPSWTSRFWKLLFLGLMKVIFLLWKN